ncbi:response regulator [Adhaeribacter sp. BT258]|uniref:Response regulator n=1 Tax=Adhaeribacter terrigena TaxID=2793070 RepID=A0ABS1C0F7_9BACT|nr:response regulator [Adhaeribacter terrigena]MBK0402005.1 response regulator [Adhaeribacter terrigena]
MTENQVSILLVEDDYLDIMNVERELKKLNINLPLHVARNGREALNMLKGEGGATKIIPKPSVVLLDINMPKMNGIEFLEAVRKDPEFRDLNVFIMTTSNEESDRLAAQNLNATGYIVKPLSFDKFGGENSTIDSFSLMLDLLKIK